MTNLVPSTSYYKHTWFRVIWVPTGLSAKILQPPPSFRTFHTFSSLIQDLGLPWFPHYPQVSGEEDITPSFLLFHLRIQGASHSSARPQAGADWCHSLMASILNCWMQPRSCVFLTQPQNSWTTALPLPRANRIDHWECKRVCCTFQQSTAGGKHQRRTLPGETLSAPHPTAGLLLTRELETTRRASNQLECW